jgi:hypothetical protein
MIDKVLRKKLIVKDEDEKTNDEDKLDLELEVDYESYKTKTIIKLKLKYIVDFLEDYDRFHYYPEQFSRVQEHKFTKYVNDKRGTNFRPTIFGCRHNKEQNTIAY